MFGFYRFASVCPTLKVADTAYNTAEIIRCATEAIDGGAAFVVFPELCITGYTCSDLFHQELLLKKSVESLSKIAEAFANSDTVIAVGLPLRMFGCLYNCAAFLQRGKLVAVTPKIHLPNQREFYEKRHFSSGRDLLRGGVAGAAPVCPVEGFGDVPVTNFFTVAGKSGSEVRVGVELCEDLWTAVPPSGELALAGANVIVNLSASDALVGKRDYRRNLVMNQSARCMAAYVYSSAGVHESTTDMVFSGHLMIAENGSMIAESKPFSRESEIIYADVDVERLNMQRLSEGSFQDFDSRSFYARAASFDGLRSIDSLKYRFVAPMPFVPGNIETRDKSCTEIFNIQCAGLAKRLEASHSARAVIGLSGGLDSTLALLVVAETFKLLKRPASEILVLTMPGFGTTKRTKNNAVTMAELLGVELRTVDIQKACLQHFADIGHDPEVTDVTYENSQARERTQVLMDLANQTGGIVVGTGDLSELALGWATYNGDHMSMYAVNSSVPKTLVRHLVRYYADTCSDSTLQSVLMDVLDTPVSPELLPPKDGEISQKTEDLVGPYELHDFFLYYVLRFGFAPHKVYRIAQNAFEGEFDDATILKWLRKFYWRFFSQQYKRSCVPDGPKVGSVAVSPRGDLRMPRLRRTEKI